VAQDRYFSIIRWKRY